MVGVGCDHGGVELKAAIIAHLNERDQAVKDYGCQTGETVDYPTIAKPLLADLLAGALNFGVLICGTGLGMSYCANRHRGVRAALCSDVYCAEMAKKHNDANILCLGGRVLGVNKALRILDAFIDTQFLGGYHARRIAMLDE